MRINYYFILLCLLFSTTSFSQTLYGVVKDSKTKEPIPYVNIYFPGTYIGAVTKEDGSFSIKKPINFNGPLKIGILGYEDQLIREYDDVNIGVILLSEKAESLDAVTIDGDPWSRLAKERDFSKFLLGYSKYSRRMRIVNIENVKLRFNPTTMTLEASSSSPLVIEHPYLGYNIIYDLMNFEIKYERLNEGISRESYQPTACFYDGWPYFEDISSSMVEKSEIIETREKLYKSTLHYLFSSIIKNDEGLEDFKIKVDRDVIVPSEEIEVVPFADVIYLTFSSDKYKIRDSNRRVSYIKLIDRELTFDEELNNLTPKNMIITGFISTLALGGQLPTDYKLENSKESQ